MIFRGKKTTWYRPTSLLELLELKYKYPNARIVVGNTEVGKVHKYEIYITAQLPNILFYFFFFQKIGVEIKFKNCQYPVMIQPSKVPELNVIKKCVKGLIVGAAVTINKLENELKKLINTMPGKIFK